MVRAEKDCLLLVLDGDALNALTAASPLTGLQVARVVLGRRDSTVDAADRPIGTILTLVGEDVADDLGVELEGLLGRTLRCARVSESDFTTVVQDTEGEDGSLAAAVWWSRIAADFDAVIVSAGSPGTRWFADAVRQADRVLLVTREEEPTELWSAWVDTLAGRVRGRLRALPVANAGDARPASLARWSAAVGVPVYPIRLGTDDLAIIARHLPTRAADVRWLSRSSIFSGLPRETLLSVAPRFSVGTGCSTCAPRPRPERWSTSATTTRAPCSANTIGVLAPRSSSRRADSRSAASPEGHRCPGGCGGSGPW